MTRTEAVARINRGLGFRAAGSSLDASIVLALQEAQRLLEHGNTLPRFLLQENQTLALASGAHTVALPSGFLREADDPQMHYFASGSDVPVFVPRKYYTDAARAQLTEDTTQASPPVVWVLRNTVVDFVLPANQNYTMYWDYYAAADELTADIENAWLAYAPEWLIGEAGRSIALDLRDRGAVELFGDLRQRGRAAIFGDDIVAELASGPIQIGANN